MLDNSDIVMRFGSATVLDEHFKPCIKNGLQLY
jgi:hypothetical protein